MSESKRRPSGTVVVPTGAVPPQQTNPSSIKDADSPSESGSSRQRDAFETVAEPMSAAFVSKSLEAGDASQADPSGQSSSSSEPTTSTDGKSNAAKVIEDPSDPLLGQTLLGRYHLIQKLGEGGMGTVYLAEHTTIKKRLAIKILSSEFSHKKDLVERFLQEARAASMINQENVVEITDFGDTPNGSVFFVMEHLDGEDLSHTIKREKRVPWSRARGMILQVCRALRAAHDAGIIHRDMKPENCFRIHRGDNSDFIKVLDFGIAKVTGDGEDGATKGLTRTGMIFGTPEYMSPEQAQGTKVDYRSDIYAVGIILYELLTGRVPFTADTFMGILTKHMFETPEAPTKVAPEAQIPDEVEAIILKSLQKDREFRFATMLELEEAILAVGTGSQSKVQVVSEKIERPATSGQMQFTAVPIDIEDGMAPVHGSNKSSKTPYFVVGFAAVGALAAGLWYQGQNPGPESGEHLNTDVAALALDESNETRPKKLEAEKQSEPLQADGTPKAGSLAPEMPASTASEADIVDTVHLRIQLEEGVEAKVYDARDDALLGLTSSTEGIELPKSQDSISLVLRAEGYEDLEFEALPDRDKLFEKRMHKLVKNRRSSRSASGRAGGGRRSDTGPDELPPPPPVQPSRSLPSTTEAKKAPSKPASETGKDKPRGLNSPDLKDPFAR